MPEAMEGPVPYTVRTLFNEETTVEREIIEHLKAGKLGWTWRSREALRAYRPDEREVLLLPLLREKLKALNPAVLTDDARIDAIITKLRGCRDNQQWLAWLKDGVNHKFDAAENAQDVRLIDHEHLDANDWWVTNQFPVEGRSPCSACHGPGAMQPMPGDHAGRAEATCTMCHAVGWKALAAPTTPGEGTESGGGAPAASSNPFSTPP